MAQGYAFQASTNEAVHDEVEEPMANAKALKIVSLFLHGLDERLGHRKELMQLDSENGEIGELLFDHVSYLA